MLVGAPDDGPETLQEWGSRVVRQFIDDFINPELDRRREADRWDDTDPVIIFQVLFPPDSDPEVRINDEVAGDVQVVAARNLEAGEEVVLEDYTGLGSYQPAEADDGVPHATGLRHRDGWDMVFDLNYQHPERFAHHALGREFATSAVEALSAGRVGVALDNAYSAAELFAKAELLSCGPAVNHVHGSRTHPGVAGPYGQWAKLGNTELRFARLLSRLHKLRGRVRYLNPGQGPKPGEAQQLMDTLGALQEHSRQAVEKDFPDGEPRQFNVVATREVRWGQVATPDAFTLRLP